MDTTQDALRVAIMFHEAYERLAPKFGYSTRETTRHFDPESANGKLMIAACAEVLSSLAQAAAPAAPEQEDAENYRWLRDYAAGQGDGPVVVKQEIVLGRTRYSGPLVGEQLDRFIRAARNQEGKPT